MFIQSILPGYTGVKKFLRTKTHTAIQPQMINRHEDIYPRSGVRLISPRLTYYFNIHKYILG